MGNYASYVFGLVFTILTTVVYAQATPTARFEAFLGSVSSDSDAALETLFAGSRIAELKPQAWAALKAQTKSAFALYGKPQGYEKIAERDFTPSLKRLTYLQKFELYPVVWHVFFYRAKDEWLANFIVVNDNIGPMLVGM